MNRTLIVWRRVYPDGSTASIMPWTATDHFMIYLSQQWTNPVVMRATSREEAQDHADATAKALPTPSAWFTENW
jgi:hypothetical protein